MDTNETTIFTAILITGIVIGTIFIYFTITIYRNHRKHFKLLSRQFVAEVELLEKERSRIATDLHDELGPILAVTRIHLNSLDQLDKEQQQHLVIAEQNITVLTERLGGIAKNLTPKALATKGLKVALQDFIEQMQDITAMRMNLEYGLKSELQMLHALHIYRMIQELIHNSLKHSGATQLNIQLAEGKNKIYFLYNDNGIGISTTGTLKHSTGLGLESIRNRIEMLGGKMEQSKTAATGVDYFFEIPLRPFYERRNNHRNSR
jgi:signal transduction histidine kinase